MRVVLVLFLTVATFGQSRAPAIEAIRKDELKADLFFLASDGMRGRLTGTPEYALGPSGSPPDMRGSDFSPSHRTDLSITVLISCSHVSPKVTG